MPTITTPTRVYLPCKVPGGPRRDLCVETADGLFVPLTKTPLEFVDGTLCAVADFVRAGDGRHLVRLADRSECWVAPSWAWKYSPDAPAPAAA